MSKRNVLITGGTSGIGLGIAHSFGKAGYNLIVTGLEANGADIAAELGKQYGINTLFRNDNLMQPAAIETMMQAAAEWGGVDILVNNAGIQHVSPIAEFPVSKWDAIIALNLSAAFHTTRLAWPHMQAQQFGRIINIASVHGLRASEFKSAYVAAKHGIVGFTKVTALEGAPYNITATAICPGYVKTPLVEGQIADQAKTHNLSPDRVVAEVMLKKQAVKDFVPVEVLGDLAVLLAGENATTFTGAAIPVDGAWSTQ